MKMPPEVLTFLLRGGHLNVEERKAKGLWPNERLRYSEVLDHLAAVIEHEEWFPRMMQPDDAFQIELPSNGSVRIISSVAVPNSSATSASNQSMSVEVLGRPRRFTSNTNWESPTAHSTVGSSSNVSESGVHVDVNDSIPSAPEIDSRL